MLERSFSFTQIREPAVDQRTAFCPFISFLTLRDSSNHIVYIYRAGLRESAEMKRHPQRVVFAKGCVAYTVV